jgi:hypothetical protein
MGDGGFWHNGLITGVASNLFNKGDGLLIVLQNGYTSATGLQFMPSSLKASRSGEGQSMPTSSSTLKTHRRHLAAQGAQLFSVGEDGGGGEGGAGQRRAWPEGHHRRRRMPARASAPGARGGCKQSSTRGERVVRTKFGVDDEICTGDHSCIRLSGCPVADGEAVARSAAHRSGGERDRILRRLRSVRRGRACRRALPVLLSRRARTQRHVVGSHSVQHPPLGDRLVRRASLRKADMPAGALPAAAREQVTA